MMTEDDAVLLQRKKRWLIATILSGVLLALCVLVGLGAAVWKMQQTMTLVDDISTTDAAFKTMVDRAILWSKIGLGSGFLAFLVYLFSFFTHHRLKQQIKDERETQRRLSLLDAEENS